jgi:hypothetical protein
MYVVGANRLSDFWREHPQAEGELRALHALLANSEPDALAETLGRIATFDPAGAQLSLATATVRIEINKAAAIVRYAAVAPATQEGP